MTAYIYPEGQFKILSEKVKVKVVSDSLRPHGTVQSMEFSRPEYNQRSFKLKKKKIILNQPCNLSQHYHYLKLENMQLKSHYSPLPKHKPLSPFLMALLHISSQIKCYSSQFLEKSRAAEKHMRSSHER